jgi:Zn-dependent metalloprotease
MKLSYITALIAGLVLTVSCPSFAQDVYEGADASRLYSTAEMVRTSKHSELPSYIRFKQGFELNTDEALNWVLKNFQIDPGFSFVLETVEVDQIGYQHRRYQQTCNGHIIENAAWILHIKNDQVVSMNGLLYKNLPSTGSFALTAEQALDHALGFIGAASYKWEVPAEEEHLKRESGDPEATYYPFGEKVYINTGDAYAASSYRAAYRFNIYAHSELYRAWVYVDAATGEVIAEHIIVHNVDTPGTATTVYSGPQSIVSDSFGGSFRLRENTRGDGVNTYDMNTGTSYGAAVDFTDADNNWNNVNAQMDEYATDAHWGAEMTYDYYDIIHGRNSIDDNGFELNSYIHYDVNYANAFWDGQRMTYGDGDGTYTPLTSVDIAGHEITHGLTTFTADLAYSAESGALNESFSDIFGTCIENYAKPTDWNWTIGEDIGSAFRSMSNPGIYGDPDTYFGNNWASLTGGDNGGVHTNSGVQNFWFYLMVTGGSGTNDNGDAYSLTGLGFNDASAIAFRNLTVYLTPNSDFADARFFAIQSAIDLFGACTPEVETTTNAWYAVGVGVPYVATVIADLTAPVVSSCSAPFTVNFSNLSVNGISFDWDFGDGGTSTANNPSHTYTAPGTYTVTLDADGGACGTGNVVMTDFITIDNLLPCIAIMPTSGNGNLQTACSGSLFDSGGDANPYGASEDAQITITPFGGVGVDLSFLFFDVEAGSSGTNCNYDYVRIYDGPNTASPLVGTYCNNNLPPATWSSSGNSVTIVFHSDGGLEESGFEITWDCVLPTSAPVADFTADLTTTCNGAIAFTDLSANGPTAWSWDFGDGGTATDQNPAYNYLLSGTYTVTLTASNGFGSDPEVKTSYITVNKPAAPNGTGTSVCANNSADLSVSGTTGTVNWYDSPGGTQVGTGTIFTTPVLTNTTIYYAAEEVPGTSSNVGPVTNAFGTGGNFNGDQHQIFTCFTPVILKSVKVYAQGDGNRTIQLRDNTGAVIEQAVVYIPNGTSIVTLNFDIPIGTGLQLGTLVGSAPALYRNNSGASYPYTQPGLISITSSSAGGAYYYFFYDWVIETPPCTSELEPVTATVTPQDDATITPVIPMCSSDAPVTLTAVDPGGSWSGTGVVGNTFDPAIAGIGNHVVTYTIPGSCGDTDTETIAVSDAFNATISSTTSLCEGDGAFNLNSVDAGGTWTGTGITDAVAGTFDPAISGTGTFTITYTIGGGCGDADTEEITVDQQSNATINPAGPFCREQGTANLTAADAGGTWSATCGTCIDPVTGVFNATLAGVGNWDVTYSVGTLCPDTDILTIDVISCLGVEDQSTLAFSIYPNPAHDQVTIKTGDLIEGYLVITDVTGRIVAHVRIESNSTVFSLQNIGADGTYFVKITALDGEVLGVEKLIRN